MNAKERSLVTALRDAGKKLERAYDNIMQLHSLENPRQIMGELDSLRYRIISINDKLKEITEDAENRWDE